MPGSPRQDIMDKQFLYSEQKQGKATFKLNETDTTWNQIWLFPATLCEPSDERARTPTRFGSELDRPQGLIQGLVRVITGDSAKATFYSALILPEKPYEIYIPIEATWLPRGNLGI